MPAEAPRIIRLVHSVPGRIRLRLSWLRDEPDEAVALAEGLAALDRSMEVKVRPWTGSVLCSYDPERVREASVLSAVRKQTRVAIVLRAGERHPEVDAARRRTAERPGSRIRDAVFEGFREMNHEVVEATDGRLDLGALTGLGFLGAGALEILTTRALPAPPWFNLAWWAYRTFTISGEMEEREEEEEQEPAPEAPGD
jgi:hypothetical protein